MTIRPIESRDIETILAIQRASPEVAQWTARDYARVVDNSWNPPVTLAVRLVSVVSDALQHAGQAMFIRGIVENS